MNSLEAATTPVRTGQPPPRRTAPSRTRSRRRKSGAGAHGRDEGSVWGGHHRRHGSRLTPSMGAGRTPYSCKGHADTSLCTRPPVSGASTHQHTGATRAVACVLTHPFRVSCRGMERGTDHMPVRPWTCPGTGPAPDIGMPTRRQALLGLLAAAAPGCVTKSHARTVLPPTAADDFLDKCIRCFRCGEVCTAGCIEFHPTWADPRVAGTPYIEPRRVACNLCMACTRACPSGALLPTLEKDALDRVDMGTAYVDEGLCLSHQGRVCGVCHDACPFPGQAIRLTPPAEPVVLDACVGCGRCEERCPQVPAAIRVLNGPVGPRWVGPK